ncbi:hypothetical protein CR194_12865 [Salipaludibacillus keqinensis]|uniref:Uncharacterized protein n=1 Tax=Salipaludibacillus keqinensis TaxID=2045207 RepID=A0A323TSY7_9BACI|nr:hypothetical protein CR194_12865 [Salipaludibacillus keqinensis]
MCGGWADVGFLEPVLPEPTSPEPAFLEPRFQERHANPAPNQKNHLFPENQVADGFDYERDW